MPIERLDRPDERPRATGGKKTETFIGKIHWKSQNKVCECFAFSEIVVVLFGHLCHFLSFWKMEKYL